MKEPTRAPVFACLYPGLCEVARARGYALAIHGTVTSDLDLIACPWTDRAVSAEELKEAMMKHIGACGYSDMLKRDTCLTAQQADEIAAREENKNADYTAKPHGRKAWNLYLYEGTKVDLSVMPRTEPGK